MSKAAISENPNRSAEYPGKKVSCTDLVNFSESVSIIRSRFSLHLKRLLGPIPPAGAPPSPDLILPSQTIG